MKKIVDLVLLAILVATAVPLATSAQRSVEIRAQRRATEQEARRVYDAFQAFYERTRQYPNASAASRFDPATLEPLGRHGFYSGSLTSLLVDQRVDGYDSPDDRGLNQEFWIEMTLAADPSIRYVVARSDNAPLGGGKWLAGVYVWHHGRLEGP